MKLEWNVRHNYILLNGFGLLLIYVTDEKLLNAFIKLIKYFSYYTNF